MSEDPAAVFAVMVASRWAFIKLAYLDLSQISRPRDTRPDSRTMNHRSITDQGISRQSLLEQLAISNASAMRIFLKYLRPKVTLASCANAIAFRHVRHPDHWSASKR